MTKEGKTLEQLTSEFELEVVAIPIKDIDPDPDNANDMDEGLYKTLVNDIRQFGFTQPALVRPVGKRFRLIDGEHRWRAVAELGMQTLPSIVIEADDDDAKLRLLTMNRLRGRFVPIKLALVIADLAKRIPQDELRKRLGLEKGELEDKLRLAGVSDDLGNRMKAKPPKPTKPKIVMRFTLRREDAQAVERIVDALLDASMDRGEALAHVCREFERAHRVEGTTTISK